jgi:transposase
MDAQTISERAKKGQEIAQRAPFKRKGDLWLVPSQSNQGTYVVDPNGDAPSCSCPDFELRQQPCKHVFAVEYSIARETAPDGTVKVTKTVRLTYAQNWPAYNAAQTNEKARVAELLRALCDGVVQPPQGRGRPRLPLSDVLFGAVMKIYGTMSARRSATDLRESAAKGHVAAAPHYNSILRGLESPALTPILKAMIEESALPLRAVESDFAVDSSGFSTCTYIRWFDEKYGKERSEKEWLKCHLMVGVKTNVVTSVEVTDPRANDCPQFAGLVASTAQRFQLAEVSADKAYLSKANLEAVVQAGAVPYIPFKANSQGEGPELWRRLFHFYQFKRSEFLPHYHKRSNVETTFSMIKAKFGGALRSKLPVAQANEILCKVLAHNLCCLVQSIYELGIEPTFWTARVAST